MSEKTISLPNSHEALERFLLETQHRREDRLAFTVARPLASLSGPRLRDLLDRCLPMVQERAVQLRQTRNGCWRVTLRLRYRAGVRIADAWQNGDVCGLSPDEQTALSRALVMAEQARRDAPDPLTLARRLYEAVRACTVYDNPTIGTAAYGQVISAVSALVRGRANCQGFSDAYYLLGTLAGLTVSCRTGVKDRMPHLWNTVLLDGHQRTVDVTAGVFR